MNQNDTTRGRRLKLRPQEFFKYKDGFRYVGLVFLENAGDSQRVARRIRRELGLSVLAIQVERRSDEFPTHVLYLREDDSNMRPDVIGIIENEVESYLDGSENYLEALAS